MGSVAELMQSWDLNSLSYHLRVSVHIINNAYIDNKYDEHTVYGVFKKLILRWSEPTRDIASDVVDKNNEEG